MPNGSNDYVTWPYFRKHEEEAAKGYQRIERLEAEVMGDEVTGRKSLRMEFSETSQNITKTIWRAVGAVAALLVGHAILTMFNFHIHP